MSALTLARRARVADLVGVAQPTKQDALREKAKPVGRAIEDGASLRTVAGVLGPFVAALGAGPALGPIQAQLAPAIIPPAPVALVVPLGGQPEVIGLPACVLAGQSRQASPSEVRPSA